MKQFNTMIKNVALACIILFIEASPFGELYAQQTVTNPLFTAIKGEVVDSLNHKPLVFASVFMEGTNIGTVTNTDGRFLIKIPKQSVGKRLGFSIIGYKTKYLFPAQLSGKKNRIFLHPATLALPELVVREIDPLQLVRAARDKVLENFTDNPMMLTGFYREWIKKNRSYVSLGEAVLDIYKAAYKIDFEEKKQVAIPLYNGTIYIDVKNLAIVGVKMDIPSDRLDESEKYMIKKKPLS